MHSHYFLPCTASTSEQELREYEKYAKGMLEMDGVMNKKSELKALPPSTTAGNANEDEDYDKID